MCVGGVDGTHASTSKLNSTKYGTYMVQLTGDLYSRTQPAEAPVAPLSLALFKITPASLLPRPRPLRR